MLSRHDMVCLSLTPWETELPSTAHFLMREFGRSNRVLFVDHPLTLKDLWTFRRHPAYRGRIRRTLGLDPALRSVPDAQREIWLLTPPPATPAGLPAPCYDAMLALSARAALRSVRRAMDRLGMRRPIVWVAFDVPLGLALFKGLEASLRVYLCYDEIAGEAYVARHGTRLEPLLMQRSDVVLTTSQALQADRSAAHPACHWVPNGVEAEHFARALDPRLVVPAKLRGLPRPVLGYLGHLESRVDYGLLAAVARARPDWSLALVGPVKEGYQREVAALEALGNVHALGPCRHHEAPAFLKGFDVALIPFVRSAQTRAIYPLKLNEYLAAGRPVVMTPFAPLGEFAGVCEVAEGPEATVAAIARALAAHAPEQLQARLDLAARNSWGARAEAISNLLVERLVEGHARRVLEGGAR